MLIRLTYIKYIEIMYKLLLFRIIFFNTSRKYYLTERHKNQHASLCNIIIIVERFCTYISCSFEYQKPDKKRCPRQYKKFMVHENNSLCKKCYEEPTLAYILAYYHLIIYHYHDGPLQYKNKCKKINYSISNFYSVFYTLHYD